MGHIHRPHSRNHGLSATRTKSASSRVRSNWNLDPRRMDKSALEKITEGVLPLIREMVREEVKNLGDGHGAHGTHVMSELEVPFKDNLEIVLFMKRPALMD